VEHEHGDIREQRGRPVKVALVRLQRARGMLERNYGMSQHTRHDGSEIKLISDGSRAKAGKRWPEVIPRRF
jgi:hypothetical protein